MRKAITESCNIYFYKLMLDLGFDKWTEYGEMFGFGDQEGIDLPGEKRGTLPSTEYYDKRYGAGRWTKGYIISLAIGQGEMNATPLQLANFAATIANDGVWHEPHLVSGYRDARSGKYVPISHEDRKLPVSKESFAVIKDGMRGVVLQGTGTLAQVPGVTVAGKTGTAQNPHGQDHAWFICFAPVEQPKIAIAVLVENAGFGGSVSAPIARELINYYVNGKNNQQNGFSEIKAIATVKAINDSLKSDQPVSKELPKDSTGTTRKIDEDRNNDL